MKKIIIIFGILSIISTACFSQLKYHSNGKLTFGDVSPVSNYKTRIEGWGHYFTYGNKFMEVCVATAAPRIAGTLDQIVFYNSETSTFNSIQVASVLNYSDAAAKTNITPINTGLSTIMKLDPVSYDWKDPHNGLKDIKTGAPKKNIGFLSQDIEMVLPELVYTDDEGKKLLNYIGLIPILTKSIQELNDKVKALESEIATLKDNSRMSNK